MSTESEPAAAPALRPIVWRGFPLHFAIPVVVGLVGVFLLLAGGGAAFFGGWWLATAFPISIGGLFRDPRLAAVPAVFWALWLVVGAISGPDATLANTPILVAVALATLGAGAVYVAQRSVFPATDPETLATLVRHPRTPPTLEDAAAAGPAVEPLPVEDGDELDPSLAEAFEVEGEDEDEDEDEVEVEVEVEVEGAAEVKEKAKDEETVDAKAEGEEKAKAEETVDAKAEGEEKSEAEETVDAKAEGEEKSEAEETVDAKAEGEEKSDADASSEPDVEAETDVEPEPDADADAEDEADAEVPPAAEAEVEPDADPKSAPKPGPTPSGMPDPDEPFDKIDQGQHVEEFPAITEKDLAKAEAETSLPAATRAGQDADAG